MKVQLKLQGNEAPAYHALQLHLPLTLGRSKSVSCPINDSKVSSNHCQFTLNEKGLELLDLKSKNGTYVNNIRIEKINIYLGDEIRVGDTKVSLDPTKMDAEAVRLLTYRGGASRLESQLSVDCDIDPEAVAMAKGIIKKKEEDPILTPAQIRKKYKGLFIAAVLLNVGIACALVIVCSAFLAGNKRQFIYQIVILAIFFLTNFKIMNFSLGEKLVGLEKKYINQ